MEILLEGLGPGVWQAVFGGAVTGAGFAVWSLRQKIMRIDKRQNKQEERQLLMAKAMIVLTQLIDEQVQRAHPDDATISHEKIVSDLLKSD